MELSILGTVVSITVNVCTTSYRMTLLNTLERTGTGNTVDWLSKVLWIMDEL